MRRAIAFGLLLLSAATAVAAGRRSEAFTVGGEVAHPATWTAQTLRPLPSRTQTVEYRVEGKPVTDSYTGVGLWDLLQRAGIKTDAGRKNDILRKVVVVTGADGYQVVLSAGELDPKFGHAMALVAYADTAGQLAGEAGFARLIVAGDNAGGRFVSGLTSIAVVDVPPAP